MKQFLSVLSLLFLAVSASRGAEMASASSAKFLVDTRPDVFIEDVSSTYCSGRYGGQGGVCAIFLTGVRCDIKFQVKASLRDGRVIDHYLVNGRSFSEGTFSFNVGSLSPGEGLRVIAVDTTGKRSDPFRVNFEVAPLPPQWEFETAVGGTVSADKHPLERRVVYRTLDVRVFSIFDALSDYAEVGGKDFPLDLAPSANLAETMDSSTGQYCNGADMGVGGLGNYGKIKNKVGRFGGLDISLGLTDGYTYDYDPRRGEWVQGHSELGVQFDGSFKVRQRVPQCPLIYGQIGLNTSASFLAHLENGEWRSDVNLDPLVALEATAGVGVDVVAAAEVSGSGGLHVKASIPGGLREVHLKGKFFWRAVFATHEKSGTWWEQDLFLYPRAPQLGAGTLRAFAMRAGDPTEDDGGFRPVPRNYGDGVVSDASLSARRGGLRLMRTASGAANPQILMQNGYPTPQPSIAVSGTDAVLAYVRDKASRADLDRTLLVVRNEASDGSWSAENAVWDDGTADFQPKLALLSDGTAVAAWTNAKRTFADGTPFEDVCAAFEIAVGVRDPQSGTWTCANLTDDAALDWVPVLKGTTNGTAAVAWVRNAAGAYIGTASQPSDLVVSFYRNGTWSPMAVAAVGIGAVLSHDIAWDGDRAVLVWAADADGDLMTDDSEIWATSLGNGSWSQPMRLSADSVGAMRPFVWFADSTPHVVWTQDGALFAADGLAAASGAAVDAPEGVSISAAFQLLAQEDGTATLFWTAEPSVSENGIKGGLLAAGYTPDAGLAAPAPLFWAEQALVRNSALSIDGAGTVRAAYESVSVSTNAEGAIVHGAVDLAVWHRDAARDVGIAAEDCLFATNVVFGVSNAVIVGLRNNGTAAESAVSYRVWEGGGEEKTLLVSGAADIPPLSLSSVEAPWTPQEGLAGVVFTVEVDPDGAIVDADLSNNELVWRPDVGGPILSLRNATAVRATDTLRLVSARLHNDAVAPLPAGMIVKFWRGEIGGELIGTDTAGMVAGGTVGEYDVGIAWDISGEAFTSDWERIVIELPQEVGSRSVSVWTTTPLYEEDDDPSGGGGGSGGAQPLLPPDIGGDIGFSVVDGRTVFNLSFHGEAGFTYFVQYKNRLDDPEWTTILTASPLLNGDVPVAIPVDANAPSRFFRVVTSHEK